MCSIDWEEVRKRIDAEDNLLNARTANFLVSNGLLITALGIANSPIGGPDNNGDLLGIVLTLLGLSVSIVWVLCSFQSWRVIRNLWSTIRPEERSDVDKIVEKALFSPGWRRPTNLLALLLPVLFIGSWAVLFVGHAS